MLLQSYVPSLNPAFRGWIPSYISYILVKDMFYGRKRLTKRSKSDLYTNPQISWRVMPKSNFTVRNRRRSTRLLSVYPDRKVIFQSASYLNQYQKYWSTTWSSKTSTLVEHQLNALQGELGTHPFTSTRMIFFSRMKRFEQYSVLHRFYSLYKLLSLRNLTKFSLFTRHLGKLCTAHLYKIYLTFSVSRLYINMCDIYGRNYVSLSVGLFLKFFHFKRSLKKNKLFRFLLVRFFRKLLLVSGIQNVVIYFKKTPVYITETFRFLTGPLPAPFFDPINQERVTETWSNARSFKIHYLYFLRSVSFTNMKAPQKGRLKRKIARKIIKNNKITD